MKNILILGSTGMLGNAVVSYFLKQTDRYNISITTRNIEVAHKNFTNPDCNIVFFDIATETVQHFIQRMPKIDYVINCIGTIKPFMKDNPRQARFINSVFPWDLSDACEKNNIKLLTISSDCVYKGSKGNYIEADLHDALDDYGKSKSLGEPTNCMVIRTSIIGEEIHKNASLIEWAKSQKGKKVNGFTHHKWNGITTTQFAIVCDKIIHNDWYKNELFHVYSPTIVNKAEMLRFIDERFKLDLTIDETDKITEPCDRSLSSTKDLSSKLQIPSVKEMILAL
jgi:dTDP-4-dehydrorhamnose reductase